MAALTLSSPSKPRWNYDVFLSFRDEDTRKSFIDHLYSALNQVGIYTFRDDDELSRGEHISTKLLKAIQGSRISIVVFSKDYASSHWCLDELVEILNCKNTLGQILLPIFYDVSPADVRNQTGTFTKAFAKHEDQFQAEMERVHKWRAALTEAANYSGWNLQDMANGFESRFIQKIVEEILRKENPAYLHVAKYPVGIDSHVKEIKDLLNLGTSDVRNVGIYGMGGIGKTTIAKAVYNEILHEFEGSSFLFNIKETSEQPNGLIHLQKQLLYDILKMKDWKIGSVDGGINLITKRFYRKKVLVVLDDVDHLKQLHSLVGNFELFGQGSTLIVTTRDKHVLTELGVNEKYKVEEMNHEESLQLFRWHAFGMTDPAEDFKKLSLDVVDYVGRLPLAAEVLGSYLSERSIIEWKSALEKLQKIPHREIQKILRISFDSLEDYAQDIFLDIACFFIGTNKEYVRKVLDGCGFFTDIGISILIDKSLLIVNEINELRMHDLIRDMGREIVRERASRDPGKHSRLWCHDDVLNVLNKHLGSEAIEGLNLNLPALEDVELKTEAFANMKNLRLLKIDGAYLIGSYECLSKELRWLHWHKCPLEFLPPNFHLENVVILDMQYSNIKQVWKKIKILNKLKALNLKGSKCLTRSPNFLQLPHLEILILEGCTSLIEVHESIEHLKKLVLLNLQGCKNLKNLPESISNLRSLKTLNLSDCIKIDKLPKQLGNMVALVELLADRTAVKQLPYSFGLLKNLKTLSLSGCKGQSSRSWMSRFVSSISPKFMKPIYLLPTSVSGLCSLTELNLGGCNLFEDEIPIDLGSLSSLKYLYLSRNNFRTLPHCIGELPQLYYLSLKDCANLELISKLPTSLTKLDARGCSSLQRFPDVPNQGSLCADFFLDSSDSLAYDLRKNLLQYMSKLSTGSYFSFKLPGGGVPNWLCYKRIGSSISLLIPSLPKGQIKGLLFCAGFAPIQDTPQEENPKISVYINGILWKNIGFSHEFHKDYPSWGIYILYTSCIEDRLASGMEVKMECEGGKYFEVKECGIHVIVDDPNAMDEDMDSDTLKRGRDYKTIDDAAFTSAPASIPLTGPEIGFLFRNKFARDAFRDRFHDRTVIAERAINLSDLQDDEFQIISRIFTQRQWQYFILPPARPYIHLVQEFYANIEQEPDTDEAEDDSPRLVSHVR
ncbi:disease resistance protein RPV1-like, partial [Corylus avellana]|uniref:disease resistance protein RPV1-like n=1 Tax=Corylus avellana TaxID=13451 RepID=UPI00286AE1D3